MTKISASQKLINNERGFTLFEIMVTLALIVILTGFTVRLSNSGFEQQGRDLTKRVRSTIRYLYNQAALTGAVHRMVFDLGDGESAQTISMERADGTFVRSLPSDDDAPPEEETQAEEEDPDDPITKAYADVALISPSDVSFSVVSGPERGTEPFRLPKAVRLAEVIVPGQEERITSGKVELYFYVGGFVDEISLVFSDQDEEKFFVLRVNPYTGLSSISRKYPEPDS